MVYIGGCPLTNIIELIKHAQGHANSLLCAPEMNGKQKTSNELIEYLHNISEAAAQTPLLFYHHPSETGVDCK